MDSEMLGIALTISATMISLYNLVLFYKQSRLMEKQTLISRSEVYSLINIEKAIIDKNTVKLNLQNMTEAPAFELGLQISFVPCTPGEKQWQFIDEITWAGDVKIKKGYPKRIVIPLKNNKGMSRLYGKDKGVYQAEALFLFSNTQKKEMSETKADNFEELKNRLMNQDIRFVAVMIALVYKDIQETVEEFEPIKDFMVDFQKHDDLEKAWKDNIPFPDKTVGYEEIPFMDYEFYHKFKSYRGRLESIE